MKFGLFDHVDRSDRSLATQFDERLAFVTAADEAGFYSYNVAEHHATPLNMVPIPGVYLAAVARATKRIRLGPLVYLLPLYSPLRLIEEICMLDHLSHGRLDVGMGRGVSAFELNYHSVDPETSRAVFLEVFEAVTRGLTQERLTFAGEHFSYSNVPMELKPYQQPHPPFAYPSSNEAGASWAGERGLHFSTLGAVERAKSCIAAYRQAADARGGPAIRGRDFPGGASVGVMRHILVADSAASARKIAEPAYAQWYASLTKLERDNVAGPRFARAMIGDIGEAAAKGSVILGTPDEVRSAIESQASELGVNIMLLSFFYGSLKFADALRSLRLFAAEVMPKLTPL
jgi:alkanesulfonate monooxygenase SsuD/methylene tetrahydromethanopterin reductase-like flavin-dependent oxidoreductase (luciferase family)